MQYVYPCVMTPEDDGGFSVSFPDVPEALTCGDNRREALEMARDGLTVALGMYVRCSEDIPAPSPPLESQVSVAVPPIVAAKLALYTAMREEGITSIALAARLGISEAAVRRLINPKHSSHISQVEKALHSVGRSLIVEVRAA